MMLETWGLCQINPRTLTCNVEKEVGQYLHWLPSYKPLRSCTITYDAPCRYNKRISLSITDTWVDEVASFA